MTLRAEFSATEPAFHIAGYIHFNKPDDLARVAILNRLEQAIPVSPIEPLSATVLRSAATELAALGSERKPEPFKRLDAALATTFLSDANDNACLRSGAYDRLLDAMTELSALSCQGVQMTAAGKARHESRLRTTEIYYGMAHSGVAPVSYQPSPLGLK